MLSLQFANRCQLMAADEPFVEKAQIYKRAKGSSAMRSVAAADMLSIDQMLTDMADAGKAESDDEISVGCPSPIGHDDDKELRRPSSSGSSSPGYPPPDKRCSSSDEEREPEEYFKPLKRLKMMKIDKTSFSISERSKKRQYRHHKVSLSSIDGDEENSQTGVKSFSICDILSHKPSKAPTLPTCSKIVRPWDCEPPEEVNPYLIPPPAHRGIPQAPLFLSQFHPQQLALHLQRVKSEDLSSAYESCSSSGRSSTGGSDCCTSPDVLNCSVQSTPASVSQHRSRNAEQSLQRSKSSNGKSNSSPLDALFQMTNKTFDELNGDPNAGEFLF